jgi:hypothetical protein
VNKTVSFEEIQQLNGADYDPKNNRTYQCQPLLKSPASDIKAHLALANAKKMSNSLYQTPYGHFYGEKTVELTEKVNNMVLHFPKAANFSQIKQLKTALLPSYYPSWIVERYQVGDNINYHQNIPIFYDTKFDRFLVFLDGSFFDVIKPSALHFTQSEHFTLYEGKDKKMYGAFIADTMTCLVKEVLSLSKDSPYSTHLVKYRQHFLDATDGERVICLALKREDFDNSSFNLLSSVHSDSNKSLLNKVMTQCTLKFEFYQGALINETIFMMNEDGTLYPDLMLCCEKILRNREEVIQIHHHDDFTYLVMPYTDDDWTMIKTIHSRLVALLQDLEGFFKQGYNQDSLMDKNIHLLKPSTSHLLNDHKCAENDSTAIKES